NVQTNALAPFIGGINRVYNGAQTPLLLAASGGYADLARLLLEKKANPNVRDQFGLTPLQHAARVGSKELTEMLLAAGAEVNARLPADKGVPRLPPEMLGAFGAPRYRGTALHLAAEGGHDEVVKGLLARKADVKACDEQGQTPLHRLLG